jgi:hypothetical protein
LRASSSIPANKNIKMDTTIEEIDESKQNELDNLFIDELTQLVGTFPEPTVESNNSYTEKLNFMDKIHEEVRSKHPEFMPPYDPSLENDDSRFENTNGYLERVYSVSLPNELNQ